MHKYIHLIFLYILVIPLKYYLPSNFVICITSYWYIYAGSVIAGVKPVCTPLLSELCAGLGECGLLLVESGRKGLYRKIRLNVSQDDVIFALRDL